MAISFVSYSSASIDSGGASELDIPAPASLQVGDLMLGVIFIPSDEGFGSGELTPPAGWVLAASMINSDVAFPAIWFEVYARVAEAADLLATEYTWTQTGGWPNPFAMNGAIAVYRGVESYAELAADYDPFNGGELTISDYGGAASDDLTVVAFGAAIDGGFPDQPLGLSITPDTGSVERLNFAQFATLGGLFKVYTAAIDFPVEGGATIPSFKVETPTGDDYPTVGIVLGLLASPTAHTFGNLSFEIEGAEPGDAEDWTFTQNGATEEYAGFDTAPLEEAVEDFEEEWTGLTGWALTLGSTTTAAFDSAFLSQAFEDFENLWTGITSWSLELDGVTVASFDTGTPEGCEDFEEEWTGLAGYSLTLGATSSASFDAGSPEAHEDFEEEWPGLDDYSLTLGVTSAAEFDTTLDTVEDFEEEWTTGDL